jgi:signal transduction histidine kinase
MQVPVRPRPRVVAAHGLTGLVLAGLAAVVYLVVVIGGEAVVGIDGEDPSLLLSSVATAVVAVCFEPVRRRTAPWCRRALRAEQPTPYEALSRFADSTAAAYAVDEVAARMAHALADGTGAAAAEVWVCVDGALQPAACWPPGVPASRSVAADPHAGVARAEPAADIIAPVVHSGALLGALVVRKLAGAQATPVERLLVDDLAAQAGLVLRNVALTTELKARVDEVLQRSAELSASRERLVQVQDAERRRLERDIHDGAQQHLVALVVNLRLAQTLVARDPVRAAALLTGLRGAVRNAEQTLTELARGVYPSALADGGVAAALADAALPDAVALRGAGEVPRYDAQVEAAVYFCCLEAVQNAVKHAAATSVVVELSGDDEGVQFRVTDDGDGFEPRAGTGGTGLVGMGDRLGALGGELAVWSSPGAGTTVQGWVPAQPVAVAGKAR